MNNERGVNGERRVIRHDTSMVFTWPVPDTYFNSALGLLPPTQPGIYTNN